MENHTRLPCPGITAGVAVSGRAPTTTASEGTAVGVSLTVDVSGLGTTTCGVSDVTDTDADGDGTGAASSADACPAHSNVVPTRDPTAKAKAERASCRMITHTMSEKRAASHE